MRALAGTSTGLTPARNGVCPSAHTVGRSADWRNGIRLDAGTSDQAGFSPMPGRYRAEGDSFASGAKLLTNRGALHQDSGVARVNVRLALGVLWARDGLNDSAARAGRILLHICQSKP